MRDHSSSDQNKKHAFCWQLHHNHSSDLLCLKLQSSSHKFTILIICVSELKPPTLIQHEAPLLQPFVCYGNGGCQCTGEPALMTLLLSLLCVCCIKMVRYAVPLAVGRFRQNNWPKLSSSRVDISTSIYYQMQPMRCCSYNEDRGLLHQDGAIHDAVGCGLTPPERAIICPLHKLTAYESLNFQNHVLPVDYVNSTF